MSPTQRALKIYKERRCRVYVAEKWNTFSQIRQDAFGFGDLLVIDKPNKQILLVQVTSGNNHNTRKIKISKIQAAKDWLDSGGKIVVMSFKKLKNGRYETNEEFITL